ncbi:hypothetical protein CYMTET_28398 [Cymbomonas tetramitiformis]|uniref:EGF-like domain-containing protein n=1 Tax=Cymbomonas tetramitiformis TaxID=36881 RepID=A0AAE0KW96_9CHLO|nr:hypothetical protein CYMTET_28398 [Cymbomonas tetramitiformis]
MSYPDLVANATYYALVVSGYRSSIAASAGVSSSQVALVSVYAGSAAVDTTVSFSDSDLAAGSTPDALSTTLGDSGLLADVFAGSEVLGAYSNSVSASSVVTTAVTQTPTAVTRSPISADGISLPARAGDASNDTAGGSMGGRDPVSSTNASSSVNHSSSSSSSDDGSSTNASAINTSEPGDTGSTAMPADNTDGIVEPMVVCLSGLALIGGECIDVDGCAATTSGPMCYETCIDIAAPGSGYTCSRCPSGMVSDGTTCVHNLCAINHGGCDLAVTCIMDEDTGTHECGECPSGTSQVADAGLSAGWRCADVDGCAEEPCWSQEEFAQPCADVAAPGTGRICEECPAGFRADQAGPGCIDVDECQGSPNGGCWLSAQDAALGTVCINEPGGHRCSSCPQRYIGTGEAGCRERVLCNTNHGNCDPRSDCTDNTATGYADCGPCPTGFEGTGDTQCADADGCKLEPCFPGVTCFDVEAPGEGRTCGSCPEGYKGDGASCEMCQMLLSLDPDMDTIVEGAMKRSATNQLTGVFDGLSDPACVLTQARAFVVSCAPPPIHGALRAPKCALSKRARPLGLRGSLHASAPMRAGRKLQTRPGMSACGPGGGAQRWGWRGGAVLEQGVQYLWSGVASDGSVVALDSDVNKRETLTLTLPQSSLTASVVFSFRLTASLRGNVAVSAVAEVSFEVLSQALVALIMGGEVQTGEGLPVVLDAGRSYDPDGEPGEMTYLWTCARGNSSGALCLQMSGEALPAYMTTPALSLEFQGSEAGQEYVLTCAIRKADRSAQASTTVTILRGAPPVPSIVPLTGKHTANSKLTLSSQTAGCQKVRSCNVALRCAVSGDAALRGAVISRDEGTLVLGWALEPLGSTAGVDLASVASTALNLPSLVLPPDALQAGGAYLFTLSAVDANGPSHVSLEVRVNSPPFGGTLSVSPTEGTLGETFTFQGDGWEDDVEDMPLWYQLRYEVVGTVGTTMMTQWQPSAGFRQSVSVAGEEAHRRLVTMHLYVKDALGAATRTSHNVTVLPMVFESGGAQDDFVDDMLAGAMQSVSNGQDSTSTVLTMASVLGANGVGESRRRQLLGGVLHNSSSRRLGQREAMMDVTDTVTQQLRLTTDTITRLAQTAALVAEEPAELSERSRGLVTTMMGALVAATGFGDPDAQLDVAGTAAVLESLSGVTVGALGGENQSAEVAAAVEVVRAAGLSSAQGLVAGEDPVQAATEVLSMRVQNDDLSSPRARAFTQVIASPGGAALSLSASTGAALGASAERVTIMVVASAVNPHMTSPGSGEPEEEGAELGMVDVVPVTDSTSISLLSGTNGSELAVSGLEEALNFTLPVRAPGARTRCVFWDQALGGYSSEGCVTLPNPAPSGAEVLWRTCNVSSLATLEAAWGLVSGTGLEAGCEETWAAVHPEYRGTDAGLRKYVGEGCQLADRRNNVSCWWEWRAARFEGPGCVWAAEVGCLCTHLTDFAGARETERGSLEAPEVQVVDTDEMARLSLTSISQSVVLLSVLGIFMLLAPMLYCVSNWYHNRERMTMLLTMVEPSFSTFSEIDGLWTWSIVDGATYAGGERAGAGPGLGTRIMEIAEQEKKRLDNERLGISEPAMLEVEAALEQLPAGPAAHAEEAEEEGDARMGDQGALHRRVTRQRRRTSLFRNLLSTGVTLGELDDPSPQSSLPADSAEPGNNRVADGAPGEGGCAAAELDKPPIADAAEPRTAVRHLATAAKATEVDKKDELCNPEVVGIDLRRVSVTLVPPLARPRTSQAMRQAKQVLRQVVLDTSLLGTIEPPRRGDDSCGSPPKRPMRPRPHDPPYFRMNKVHQGGPPTNPSKQVEPLNMAWPSGNPRDHVITCTTTDTDTTPATVRRGPQNRQVKERRASGTQNLGARGSLDAHLTPSSGPLQSHLAGAAAVVESYNRLQESPRSASPTGRSALLGAADQVPGPRERPARRAGLALVRRMTRKRSRTATEATETSGIGLYLMLAQRIQESAFARKRQDPAGKDGKEVVKKAKKPTAEALFKSMSVNIYRLQLCIPLDYLETQALLEVQDDSRRHRLDATSAGSRGLTQVTSGGAAVPVMERLEQSSKLSGLLKHITVDSRAPGTAEKQAGGAEGGAGGKSSSWSMVLSLVNKAPAGATEKCGGLRAALAADGPLGA